ncbi:polyketide synthase [Streptomyces hoynatensis]|uniref:Polyketide synthase n=2 Tax=Streptomyces hoynatensis TaxID=1141874 RepID=A0A3A9ZGP4_9ACTN|nr:polyketide synthase [Streptomyces hoynatensis]
MRIPGGIEDEAGFRAALEAGRDLIRPLPEARKTPFEEEWAEVPARGGFLDEVMDFDADFFGISAREARNLDPQHRLLLEVAWEALEDAALVPERLQDARVGAYVGLSHLDYKEWQTEEPEFSWAMGNAMSFAAGRLAYTLGLTGPAMTVDTACSSSLVTVHLARQALLRGECDLALAGGANVIASARMMRVMTRSGLLAPDGLCKSFDARANGYARAEGSGIVVLKRYRDALRDNDRVHAVIQGSAVNQDGRSTSISAPSVLAQIALIKAALADAGLTAEDIGLLEAHGTGTALGDPIEMEAVLASLGRRPANRTLYLGSVKSNLGHMEAAAGIAGLLKAVLCVKHRVVPPLVNFRTLNPRIDLAGAPIVLPTRAEPWVTERSGAFAGVSSFGLSGTNAHVIVGPPPAAEPGQEAPGQEAPGGPEGATGFVLTARTPEALRQLAARYGEFLDDLPEADYPAFAYTASQGRTRHKIGAYVAAPGPARARAALRLLAEGAASPDVVPFEGAPGVEVTLPRRVLGLPHYPWQRRRHAVRPAAPR